MDVIAGALFLAFFVEGLIGYLWGDREGGAPREWLKYVSLAFGVVLAFVYQLDVVSLVAGGLVPIYPFVGYVVTGVIIGRGSNYVNDLVGSLRK